MTGYQDVDLLDPACRVEASAGPLRLLVWAGPDLLGVHDLPEVAPDECGQQLRQVVDRFQVALLARAALPPAPPSPSPQTLGASDVTVVVVPDERDPSMLPVLAWVDGLAPAPAEVLLVSTARAVTASAHRLVRVVSAPGQTPAQARDTGRRAAGTELVAHVRPRSRPHPRFAASVAAGFHADQVAAVVGTVLPTAVVTAEQRALQRWLRPRPAFLRRDLGHAELVADLRPEWMEVDAIAFRTAALDAAGGADPRLLATAVDGAAELELLHRLLLAGSVVAHEPGAVVHQPLPADWAGVLGAVGARVRGVAAVSAVRTEHRAPVASGAWRRYLHDTGAGGRALLGALVRGGPGGTAR